MFSVLAEYPMGDMLLRYVQKDSGQVGMRLLPAARAGEAVEPDCAIEPLVQFKLLGDAYAGSFGNGVTMRDSASVDRLEFVQQAREDTPDGFRVVTLMDAGGIEVTHEIEYFKGYGALKMRAAIKNNRGGRVTLELLSSFALGMLSPFENGLQKNNLRIHRMRSRWASEAVLQSCPTEELLLVPSSLREEVYTERFGHVGNKPTSRFIPFTAVEDVRRRMLWGAMLTHASSWQIELSRKDGGLSMSGGLADADFGGWMKHLEPGEAFEAPVAFVTACEGGVDDLCNRLVALQARSLGEVPECEKSMPVIFNEWCTSWGCPDEANMRRLTERLKGWPVRYLVMDAGWYKGSAHEWFEMTGDWIPSREKYPNGLKATCDMIREAGFIPGIWFELETCGALSEAYRKDELLLKRHGFPLISKNRKFWDFRDPRVWDSMCRRVIGLMHECGIGYIKVDSNESAGIGCDGAESLGEGLRQNIGRLRDFFIEMRRQIPDLVIENCSSGGQRLVDSFMSVSSLASFSDAFETEDIPIIAANLHRVIPPAKSEVWCIVRKGDDEKRLLYKLTAGFLGRIDLSGDVYDLSQPQVALVREALDRYAQAAEVIRNGQTKRFGPAVSNYREPDGWQAVVRMCGNRALVVVHTFRMKEDGEIRIALPEGDWKIEWTLKRDCVRANIASGELRLSMQEPLEGAVWMLNK